MIAAERVARGAALLAEKRPGWAARIDLSRLDLENSCRCVLGQLWNDPDIRDDRNDDPYFIALDDLYLSDDDAVAYGFNAKLSNAPISDGELIVAYGELDELWIAEIKRRTATP